MGLPCCPHLRCRRQETCLHRTFAPLPLWITRLPASGCLQGILFTPALREFTVRSLSRFSFLCLGFVELLRMWIIFFIKSENFKVVISSKQLPISLLSSLLWRPRLCADRGPGGCRTARLAALPVCRGSSFPSGELPIAQSLVPLTCCPWTSDLTAVMSRASVFVFSSPTL